MGLVDADPGLDRYGNPELVGGPHRGTNDGAQPVAFVGQHPSPALPGDLGNGAAEIEVDVVDAVLGDQDPRRPGHDLGVHAVELHRTDGLARVEGQHGMGLVIAGDDSPRCHHLADVQPGPLLQAERPVGGIRYPCHRGQHHRERHHDGVASAGSVQA